jgi:hypothetical protein
MSVGVMKDYNPKLRNLRASHTLTWHGGLVRVTFSFSPFLKEKKKITSAQKARKAVPKIWWSRMRRYGGQSQGTTTSARGIFLVGWTYVPPEQTATACLGTLQFGKLQQQAT